MNMKRQLIAIVISMTLVGCGEAKSDAPKFKRGEIVRTVLGNHRAQILSVGKTWYKVRVDAISVTTNTRALGPDGSVEVSPWTIAWLEEFELKKEGQ